MNEIGSMPKPRYIDVESFKISYKMAIYAGLDALRDQPIQRDKAIAVMSAVFEALDAFPTATIEATNWTPCAEGLPDIMRRVIVTASGEIVIASKQHELDDDETTPIHWYDDEGCRFNDDVVTAWMPMPEPWTGGLDGK